MNDFFRRHAPCLSGLSAIGQLLAAIVAALALVFTWRQIVQTREAVKATTTYQIQKDGRDLALSLINKPELVDEIYRNKETGNIDQREVNTRIGAMINFYSSVHLQYKSGTLNENLWRPFLTEFCSFIELQRVKPVWEGVSKSNKYRPDFIALPVSCK